MIARCVPGREGRRRTHCNAFEVGLVLDVVVCAVTVGARARGGGGGGWHAVTMIGHDNGWMFSRFT